MYVPKSFQTVEGSNITVTYRLRNNLEVEWDIAPLVPSQSHPPTNNNDYREGLVHLVPGEDGGS